jgi:hypothetical protein
MRPAQLAVPVAERPTVQAAVRVLLVEITAVLVGLRPLVRVAASY